MNERALLAILTAVIWSEQRQELDDPDEGEEAHLAGIREAISFADDILVEVDEYMKAPAHSRIVDAEIVDDEPPVRRRR